MANPVTLSFKVEDDGKGMKALVMDADSLRKVMEVSVTEAQKLQSTLVKLNSFNNILNSAIGALTQISGTLKSLTGDAAEFGKAMRAANTMAGKDATGFVQLKKDVTGLAKEVPIARDLLANGLYQVISNGVPEDNWMEFLRG